MKPLVFLTIAFLLNFVPTVAQQQPGEDQKVQIFTYEEKANLQDWFHQEIKRMQERF